MGDRGNIRIEEQNGHFYFYTHYNGSELPKILARALKRGEGRWDDPSYLSRIIFSEMIKDDVLGSTGYGISVERGDYNYNDLVVNTFDLSVRDRDGNILMYDEFVDKYSTN